MARVVIIGAGMVGAACAAELAGRVDLTVVEANRPAGGATAACMGHVVVMDDSEAQFALSEYSRRLWDEVDWPASVERDRCGTLWLAEDDEELAAARSKRDFYTQRGAEAEMLDAESLRRAEPQLRPDLIGALRIPGDSVVYPPAAVAVLLERAARQAESASRAFELRVGRRVVSLDGAVDGAADGSLDGAVVLDDGSRLEADWVVIAAGLGAIELLGKRAGALRIRPRKGHLVITDRRPGFCHHQLVELGYLKSAHGDASSSVAFNLQPRATGQMLVGSSRQADVATRETEPELVAKMLRRAAHFLPRLGELQAIRIWTGLRPATDDHLPYVGPFDDVTGGSSSGPRLCLAAGHEGLGITTATGTARLVAHHLLGDAVPIDPQPYLPSRARGATP